MILITNPKNECRISTFIDQNPVSEKFGTYVRPINEISFEIKFDDNIPEFMDSKTEFVEPIIDRFIEHENTDWERFFGFVVPKKIAYFYMIEQHRYAVSDNYGNIVSGRIK